MLFRTVRDLARTCLRLGVIVTTSLVATSLISPTLANGSLFTAKGRDALTSQPDSASNQRRTNASLFKAAGAGFFAPTNAGANRFGALDGAKQMERLRQLIETAESRRHGYNAVQHAARIKPAKKPTQMTIGEIYDWIDDTPKQHHAIGRYQFIPDTLRRLVKKRGLRADTRFSPRIQDQLADILLVEAGLNKLKQGEITRHAFMTRLAKIWAGFPTKSGKSYYDGYAGNKASISWETFDAEMAAIFPS